MIGKLIGFEITKKWRSAKFILLGYLCIQTLILFITRMFVWNDKMAGELSTNGINTNNLSLPFALSMLLFFMLAFGLGAFPFIEGVYRFERDLSGKQAYLELMLPAVSWKKLLSKLISVLCSLIVCGTISLLSMLVYFAINSNFATEIINLIRMNADIILQNLGQFVLVLIYLLFSFASAFMIVFFCISIAKSFTHKNTVAVPLGILAFLIICGLNAAMAMQLDRVPLVEFSVFQAKTSLSRTLWDIVVFLVAMAGTSWLMEKKIEH